jgi:hypothetical protein
MSPSFQAVRQSGVVVLAVIFPGSYIAQSSESKTVRRTTSYRLSALGGYCKSGHLVTTTEYFWEFEFHRRTHTIGAYTTRQSNGGVLGEMIGLVEAEGSELKLGNVQ